MCNSQVGKIFVEIFEWVFCWIYTGVPLNGGKLRRIYRINRKVMENAPCLLISYLLYIVPGKIDIFVFRLSLPEGFGSLGVAKYRYRLFLSRILLGEFVLGALEFVGLRFKTSPRLVEGKNG